jgi:hypothetical protein
MGENSKPSSSWGPVEKFPCKTDIGNGGDSDDTWVDLVIRKGGVMEGGPDMRRRAGSRRLGAGLLTRWLAGRLACWLVESITMSH